MGTPTLGAYVLLLLVIMGLSGCGEVLNNPHPSGSEKTNSMFLPFSTRSPKYLDPASSSPTGKSDGIFENYGCLLAGVFVPQATALGSHALRER